MAFNKSHLVVMVTADPNDLSNGRRHVEWQMVTGRNAPDAPRAETMAFGPVKKWHLVVE
jgi:hypothetical protein